MTLILNGTDNSVSAPAVQGGTAGTTTGVYYPATNQVALATNGTQAVLVDASQNVGIGTSSPVSQLTLAKTSDLVFTQNGYGIAWGGDNGSPKIYGTSGGSLSFKHGGGSVGMVLDASGNVGIGTSSPIRKLTVSTAGTAEFVLQDTSQAANSRNWRLFNASNALYFGTLNDAGTAGNDYLVINSSGNVGIGTTSPGANLEVKGASGQNIYVSYTSGSQLRLKSDSGDSGVGTTGATPLLFLTNNAEKARISSAGGLSVGTTSDPGAGGIYATGNITAYFSDDRLKTKLGNIQDALSKVKTLNGFYYEANQTAQDLGYKPVREAGVSAQQVQAVLPEVVKPAPIDAQYLTVDYERLVPLLIEAIKELDAKVEGLMKA